MPVKAIGGFDYYRRRLRIRIGRSIHGARRSTTTTCSRSRRRWYWMQTVTVLPSTDISAGGRIAAHVDPCTRQRSMRSAPGANQLLFRLCFPNGIEALPLDKSETNHAWHLGVEQRFGPHLARVRAHGASFPRAECRRARGHGHGAYRRRRHFELRTQKSHDWKAARACNVGPLEAQWSDYNMNLTDEIHFRFRPNFTAININLDPTRRYGHETIVALKLTDDLRLKGGLAYTRAVFREGLFAGNDVPLVSRWTGNGGVSMGHLART